MKENSRGIDGRSPRSRQRGFSLLETMFATFILLIGVTGLMTLFVVAGVRNTNNGDQATRTTEYAQDKMEQLLALSYTDFASDVTGPPPVTVTCTGCGLTNPGGSLTTTTTGFSDCIDTSGTPLRSPTSAQFASAAYTRYWQIDTPPSGTSGMIRITVKVVANLTIGSNGVVSSLSPVTTLVSLKSNAIFP